MIKAEVRNRISSFAIWLPVVVSLLLTRGINIDPVNLPKMVALVVGAGYLAGLLIPNLKSIYFQNSKLMIAIGVMLTAIIISTITSTSPFVQLFYGGYGRNTGVLTYLALITLFVALLLTSNACFFDKALVGLFSAGLFNSVYGIFQINGIDPIDWNNTFHAIIGTFGNPNFSSAFISISSLAIPYLIVKSKSTPLKFFYIVAVFINVYAIEKTNSQQGYIFLAVGLSILVTVKLLKSSSPKYLGFGALLISFSGAVVGLLGILQKGPLEKYLYQPSVSLRGFYWHAGLSMFSSNPIFGKGLDSYGDNYLRYRSAASILPPGGANVFSNASHNVFIDLAASGGLLLIIPYFFILGYASLLVFKVLRSKSFDWSFTTLIAVWVAFQIESVMSINQIGLAVWVWAINGLVIAKAKSIINEIPQDSKVIGNKKKKNESVSAGHFLVSFATTVIALILVLPEQIADMNFKSGMASQNVQKIEKAINSFPLSSERLSRTSQVFLRNSLYDDALKISEKAVEFNPDSLNSWITLATNPKASKELQIEAKANLIRLDPRSEEWKKITIK